MNQSGNAAMWPSGIYGEMINHDRLYESMSNTAIIVNTFNVRDEAKREELNKLLHTEYEGDALDTKPSCDCRKTTGEYNRGIRCTHCGTVVTTITERPLVPSLWLQVPEGVHAFILPRAWSVLNEAFRYRGIMLIEWLCDSNYVPQGAGTKNVIKSDPIFERIRQMGWKRSINYFIENFNIIISTLLDIKIVKPVSKREEVRQFVVENLDRFFPKYLPVPNRALFITEKTQMGPSSPSYVDHVMYHAIDAVLTITSLNSGISPPTQRVRENRTVKVVKQLSDYYNEYMKSNLASKPGMFRKQVYGARLDTSGRAVITSLSHPHHYDELHFPWGMSVMMFKTHITNKLLRLGMTPNECEEFLMRHTLIHHPLLEQIFKELIEESPYPGIPVILQRNPTLVRASAQQFYVTMIKNDPTINSISISTLCLSGPNADFDGDEMNTFMLVDSVEHDAFHRLAPHFGVMDTHEPFKVSSNVKIPGPIIATISHWMHEKE